MTVPPFFPSPAVILSLRLSICRNSSGHLRILMPGRKTKPISVCSLLPVLHLAAHVRRPLSSGQMGNCSLPNFQTVTTIAIFPYGSMSPFNVHSLQSGGFLLPGGVHPYGADPLQMAAPRRAAARPGGLSFPNKEKDPALCTGRIFCLG